MFRAIRFIIGWFFILMGYVGVYTTIMSAVEGGITVVGLDLLTYAISDLFIIIGTVITGGRAFRGKPSFDSVWIAIIVVFIMLLLYPILHFIKHVFLLLKWIFSGFKSVGGGEDGKDDGTIDPKVKSAVRSSCMRYKGRERIGEATEVEYSVVPSFFSHQITLDAKLRFSVDNSRLKTERDVEEEKSAIETYKSNFNLSRLENEVESQIDKLRESNQCSDGSWRVISYIKSNM